MKQHKIAAFTLLEMLVVLGIVASVTLWQFHRRVDTLLANQAGATASLFADYNKAVAAYIHANTGSIRPISYQGSAWLKDRATCTQGSGNEALLPCDFPDRLPFNLGLRTQLTDDSGVINATIRAGSGPLQVGNRTRSDLAATIVTQTLAKSSPLHPVQYIRIAADGVITASLSSVASQERYLRVDGKNQMLASLQLGGNSLLATGDIEFGSDSLSSGNVRLRNDRAGRLQIDASAGVGVQGNLEVAGVSRAAEMIITALNNGQALSEGVYFSTVAAHSSVINKPQCPPGKVAQIFVSPALYSADSVGRVMGAVQSAAEHIDATRWRVLLRILTANGWVSPRGNYGRNIVFTKCS